MEFTGEKIELEIEPGSRMRAKLVVEEQTWESEILCPDYH